MNTAAPTPRRRAPSLGTPKNTESALLDAAEAVFGDKGYEGATIRVIAEAAGANLGALHYYWGSKEALFRDMCERRLRPVVEQRLRGFDACVAAAGGGVPALEDVLRASLVPALVHDQDTPAQREAMRKLLARILSDPSPAVRQVLGEIFDEASFRYVRLLRQCCPHLDEQSFFWRLHGVLGTAQHVNAGVDRLLRLSNGKFDGHDVHQGVDELVHMLKAALLAPALPAADAAPRKAPRQPARPAVPTPAGAAAKRPRQAPAKAKPPGTAPAQTAASAATARSRKPRTQP